MEKDFIKLGRYIVNIKSIAFAYPEDSSGACANGDYFIVVETIGGISRRLYYKTRQERDKTLTNFISKLKE
jgi:hypothetical protein